MAKQFANSKDPDQTPRSVASDVGLHCLPITLLGVSRLQWVKINRYRNITTYVLYSLLIYSEVQIWLLVGFLHQN